MICFAFALVRARSEYCITSKRDTQGQTKQGRDGDGGEITIRSRMRSLRTSHKGPINTRRRMNDPAGSRCSHDPRAGSHGRGQDRDRGSIHKAPQSEFCVQSTTGPGETTRTLDKITTVTNDQRRATRRKVAAGGEYKYLVKLHRRCCHIYLVALAPRQDRYSIVPVPSTGPESENKKGSDKLETRFSSKPMSSVDATHRNRT